MPPPVLRESYTVAFGNLRRLLDGVKDAQDPKEAIMMAFQAISASAEISDNLVMSVGALEDTVNTWESAGSRSFGKKSLSESKCVSNQSSERGNKRMNKQVCEQSSERANV